MVKSGLSCNVSYEGHLSMEQYAFYKKLGIDVNKQNPALGTLWMARDGSVPTNESELNYNDQKKGWRILGTVPNVNASNYDVPYINYLGELQDTTYPINLEYKYANVRCGYTLKLQL